MMDRNLMEVLARYNAEVSRGLVHTEAWHAKMAELQRRFGDEQRTTTTRP